MILGGTTGTSGAGKGWFVDPWNSRVPVAVEWAAYGSDDPHHHGHKGSRGRSVAVVDGKRNRLRPGDMLVVEPDEARTFIEGDKTTTST
jgi:hypothetical protein